MSFWKKGKYKSLNKYKYMKEFTEYEEEKDHNSLEGYSETIYPRDIKILKYWTESIDDTFTDWNTIKASINTLGNPERGTSNRENAFIAVWFEKNGKDEDEVYSMYSKL